MPKQSVINMLKRPLSQPVKEAVNGNDAMHVMARLEADAKKAALDELQPRVDAAVAAAKAAQTERDLLKEQVETLREHLVSMQMKHEQMTANVSKQESGRDAANSALRVEVEKNGTLTAQVAALTARIDEVERHNVSLKSGITGITTEIGKRKPEPVRPAPIVPNFDFEVTSRGLNGEIKTVSIKPKK